MMKTMYTHPAVNTISCVWIETGNPKRPLACVWIDDKVSFVGAGREAPRKGDFTRTPKCA